MIVKLTINFLLKISLLSLAVSANAVIIELPYSSFGIDENKKEIFVQPLTENGIIDVLPENDRICITFPFGKCVSINGVQHAILGAFSDEEILCSMSTLNEELFFEHSSSLEELLVDNLQNIVSKLLKNLTYQVTVYNEVSKIIKSVQDVSRETSRKYGFIRDYVGEMLADFILLPREQLHKDYVYAAENALGNLIVCSYNNMVDLELLRLSPPQKAMLANYLT